MELFDVLQKDSEMGNLYHMILRLRERLLALNFWNEARVAEFINELGLAGISILKYQYDRLTGTITIKVRKSIMKKAQDFRTESLFYYPFVTNAIFSFFSKNKEVMVPYLKDCISPDKYYAPGCEYQFYNALMAAPSIYNNLVNVQCIGDGTIQIVF